MKTKNNLYSKLCSKENLFLAYKKARKRKSKNFQVKQFEENLFDNLENLRNELVSLKYKPSDLKRFIICDPKNRVIHASKFKDRVVHHALINIIGPIFEKIFIYDSYASRRGKGTLKAVKRFDTFKRKVSCNGKTLKGENNTNIVEGYVLKADIEKYFDTVDHEVLIDIIGKKIKDKKVIILIRRILVGFEGKKKGRGMPLGNYTSQFFANVYLNHLDYFVKHRLKARYYIRYVDDFLILHARKDILEDYLQKINLYLLHLKIKLHLDKSKIIPLRNGISFLGYRIFYHYKLLRKRNLINFIERFNEKLLLHGKGEISDEEIIGVMIGWFGYSKWANTYVKRKEIIEKINIVSDNNLSSN